MKYLCENCVNFPCSKDMHMMQTSCPVYSPKPKTTNYDRIRSMSVEKLAEFVDNIIEYWGKWCPDDAPVDPKTLECLRNGGECRLCVLDWLKQEVEA